MDQIIEGSIVTQDIAGREVAHTYYPTMGFFCHPALDILGYREERTYVAFGEAVKDIYTEFIVELLQNAVAD